MQTNQKNIILIGFMGVGKTTVGKELARYLGMTFVDLDQAIESEAQQTIVDIFRDEGESGFRLREQKLFLELSEQRGTIISLGGGAFLQEEIQRSSLLTSLVIFLDIDFSIWSERLPLLIKDRPLLQKKSKKEIKELYELRRETYLHAHYTINTERLTPPQTAEKIAKTIQYADA
ncbi:shikimate kinase [Alkalicoccobacillus plakortidis]|uniref:Shikimate kinase n=1 Tax=Alkalicoccobacillus plakortidis TaxID=444060 RepID=A0ABT0XGU0_9BACI|nr:shikimate kinase [Alkalicoccobacillus plakortidis]MCM2674985.1 shikimate kinase [Alkalicoccobacillus plakortidis]